MYTKPYESPILVVDSIVFQIIDGELHVLLLQRSEDPFAGWWALPGGYCAAGETTRDAMTRIVAKKAGLATDTLRIVEQLYTFDTVARDPRGHAVSVAYMGLGRDIQLTTSETTQNPTFFPVDSLPAVAYDHESIIKYAHERLASKLEYTNISFALLPETFTLPEVQSTYEAVLGRPLDKRNFRKKFQSLDLISPTDEMRRSGAHRPAHVYRFKSPSLQSLSANFS